MGHAVFSSTSWQCFTIFCDIQQELIILAGTDKCLTSPKMNSIHFEGRRSLQTTKKNPFDSPTTCHVCVDTRFTWYQVPESMLHLECVENKMPAEAAKLYNIPNTTLRDRLSGRVHKDTLLLHIETVLFPQIKPWSINRTNFVETGYNYIDLSKQFY